MSEITYGKATEANIKLARQAIIEIEEETKAVGTSRRTVEKTINEKITIIGLRRATRTTVGLSQMTSLIAWCADMLKSTLLLNLIGKVATIRALY